MPKYVLSEGGFDYNYGPITAENLAAALAEAAANPGTYDTSDGTVWVEVAARLSTDTMVEAINSLLGYDADAGEELGTDVDFCVRADTDLAALEAALRERFEGEVEHLRIIPDAAPDRLVATVEWSPVVLATILSIDPPEPDCAPGHAHDWCSPYDVLGGLAENPGVQGRGGGVIIREVCQHCGTYRERDTWAQDRCTGQQGLESVRYEDADEVSYAYVLRRRIVALATEFSGEHMGAAVEAVTGISIIYGYSGLWVQALIDGVNVHLSCLDRVEDVVEDIIAEYHRRHDDAATDCVGPGGNLGDTRPEFPA